MAVGDTSLSGDGGRDAPPLNLQLLRVLLRAPVLGSPLYLQEEDRLVGQLLGALRRLVEQRPVLCRRHDPEALASDVCCALIPMWRNGVPFWFSHTYLRHLLRRRLAEESAATAGGVDLEAVADRRRHEAGRDEEIAGLLRLAEEFRAGLDEDHRELFDAWVRYDGRPGWKIDHARRTHRSPTWVTNHLNRLRQRLRQQHHLEHPDAFIEVVQFYHPGREDASRRTETPAPALAAPGPPSREWPPRVNLEEAFAGEPALLGLVRVYGHPGGLTERHIAHQLFGAGPDAGQSRLDALLAAGRDRYLAWARDVGRPRVKAWKFYRRIASGRANVRTLLVRNPDWTDEQRPLALAIEACARPGRESPGAVAFDELPGRLGVSRRAADDLLLLLRAAAYRPGRPR
jgi:hypothetical protein